MKDTTSIGAAAVHIVCADLLLAGYKAFIAPEGLHYDVILDSEGKLFRIQVKSTLRPRVRSGRPSALPTYQFTTMRNARPTKSGKINLKSYAESEVDLFACVAIDIRAVAYLPVIGKFLTGIHLYPPGTESWLRSGRNERRRIDEFPITDHIGPTELHRISWEAQ